MALVVGGALTLPAARAAGPASRAGSLYAFGLNKYRELGVATPGTLATATPTAVSLPGEIGTVAQAALGAFDSLVATSSGQLYAFGLNSRGELGLGAGVVAATPTLVTLPGESGRVSKIAGGEEHSLVVTTSGQLYSFGDNQLGQLGNTTNVGQDTANPTPTLIPLPGLVLSSSAVSRGRRASALRGGIRSTAPARTPIGLPGQLRGAALVAAGEFHSLVAARSGQIYAFGSNDSGQLGNTTNVGHDAANPTLTLVSLPGEVGTPTQLAAGAEFSLVLTSSGQVYAFGNNRYGQLGNATNIGSDAANPTPTLVSLPGAVGTATQVAAGGEFSLVVTSSGQLYAFGTNFNGELGNANGNGVQGNANPTPTQVVLPGQVGGVVQVAAGVDHTLALTSSGQLYAFGDNQFGELGIPSQTTAANGTPALVTLPAGTTIDSVALGEGRHSLVLVADLTVVATGPLPAGQVGAAYNETLSASGGTAPLRWSASGLPGGLSLAASSGAITGSPTAAGSASVKVTVTDAYGVQASHAFTLAITPRASSGGPTATAAPNLTALAQSHAVWREGSALATIAGGRRPRGTTFSFTLDQPAAVLLAFTQQLAGRKVRGHCVARNRGNRGKPGCTRSLARGSLQLAGHSGSDHIAFQGRLSKTQKLPAGHYAVAITATNAAGMSSAPHTLVFTITR